MTDPISGGIGKASQQMVTEMQQQMKQATDTAQQPGQFQDVMAKNGGQVPEVQKTQQTHEVNKVQEATKATDVLRTAQSQSVNGVDPKLGIKPVAAADKTKNAGFHKLLNQIADGQNKLDDIIKMATSGKQYSNQELLAIQASVYKFSQELDLTSKVVEKATSGIKQTMQTQV